MCAAYLQSQTTKAKSPTGLIPSRSVFRCNLAPAGTLDYRCKRLMFLGCMYNLCLAGRNSFFPARSARIPRDTPDTPTASLARRHVFDAAHALSSFPQIVSFFCAQIGGSEHSAEMHWVHLKEGTEDELLVVGVLFDTSEYGSNVEVSS